MKIVNSEFLIEKPFKELYPLDAQLLYSITQCVGYNNIEPYNLIPEVIAFGSNDDYTIAYCDIIRAMRSTSVLKIIKKLYENQYQNVVVIFYGYSKTTRNMINQFNMVNDTYFIVCEIKEFLSNRYKDTVPVFMGKYVSKSIGDYSIPKKQITIFIPKAGIPEINLPPNPNASDIYKVLESKIVGNGISKEDKFKVVGFDKIMEAFMEFIALINEGKNITTNRWNDILDRHGVFEHLEAGDE